MNMMYMTKTMDNAPVRIAVIGGGAAGLVAAATAAEQGGSVVLYEKNKVLGRKLRITGKGRCNVTNDCSISDFMPNIKSNPRFMWTALSNMPPSDTIEMFESLGVPLKTERGRRVFPVSDIAGDIAGALIKKCRSTGVHIIHEKVEILMPLDNHKFEIISTNGSDEFDNVIVCTGGMSYPLTGSDGDGYKFAEKLGHTITTLTPSLVPIICSGRECAELEGLSLKNTGLKIIRRDNGKTVYEDFGEMLFTHFGMSGPMILSASAHISDISPNKYKIVLDLKPALEDSKLDARLLTDFAQFQNRDFANALDMLLPRKMIPIIVRRSGISPDKKVNSITKQERASLLKVLKNLDFDIIGLRPIDEAIITRGGISVKEIDPKTMQSKLVLGLFFAGEVIDVDAYTGGYNLQIAFSTAKLAGQNVACAIE